MTEPWHVAAARFEMDGTSMWWHIQAEGVTVRIECPLTVPSEVFLSVVGQLPAIVDQGLECAVAEVKKKKPPV